ncbi:hypothetical protein AAF712_011519 [Marasmius tenuissimus]|uniref:Uncharacterized protein n=1 Tax=Marasmius tenuissimus TaxID=585030 RepID=A0ABR2ZKG2_9AGAR
MADLALQYPRQIIVDDTDPRIIYDTGTWNFDVSSFNKFGVLGSPYNETMKGTSSASASFTFTFEGEYIQIKGAKDNSKLHPTANSTEDRLDLLPKYTCQIDGRAVASVAYSASTDYTTNLVLCEQSSLAKTSHTISMSISVNDPDTQIFWLDSIEYAPLEGANMANQVLKVDSSDTSCVYHNGTGSWQNNLRGLNATEAAGASMSFRFNGTSVSLYGTNLMTSGGDAFANTTGSYSIDNGAFVSFDIPQTKLSPSNRDNDSLAWANQRFFATGSELDGSKEHEMVITYIGAQDSTAPPQWLTVDYFLVGNDGSQVNKNLLGSGVKEGNANVKLIVGTVVGGVSGILLIAGLIWYVMKKRNKTENSGSALSNGEAWTGELLPRDFGTFEAGAGAEKGGELEDEQQANSVGIRQAQREMMNQQVSQEMDDSSRYSRVTGSTSLPGYSIVAPPSYKSR